MEADKEQTLAAYQNLPLISEECSCTYCLNFVSAYAHFPLPIKDFFEQFGIDPRKEGEVYQLYEWQNDGELIYAYAGFYHFVGRIIRTPTNANLTTGEPSNSGFNFKVFENFEVNFNNDIQLVPENFPEPNAQLEFQTLELPCLFDQPTNMLFKKPTPEN